MIPRIMMMIRFLKHIVYYFYYVVARRSAYINSIYNESQLFCRIEYDSPNKYLYDLALRSRRRERLRSGILL